MKRGVCDRCGMHKKIRKDGMIAGHTRRSYSNVSHRGGGWPESVKCEGSGQPPRETLG